MNEQQSMNSKNILLLGGTSFTGSHTLNSLQERYSFKTVGRKTDFVDIIFDVYNDDISSLRSAFEWANVVINCFSNGDVDSCEVNPQLSSQLNLEFPKILCGLQKEHDFHLIHFSSNAVYDGDHPLYSETSEHHPINTYGRLKSEADLLLINESERCTLLRPITMFGKLLGDQRHNPFSFFFNRLLNNQDIIAVNDVYVNMLHVDVLTNCIEKVIDESIYDEFNISGDDIVNRFEFVSEIKKHLPSSTSTITETDSSGFVTAALRPLNTSFDNTKMKARLNISPIDLSSTIEHLVSNALKQADINDGIKRAA
jgi:dTDP-4-dehydrorhamnose reductase